MSDKTSDKYRITMSDTISRQAAIDALIRKMEPHNNGDGTITICIMSEGLVRETLNDLPPAQPERLTDDDFETIRIHLNAQKEKLCNQRRWEEAEEYQRIIDRFMAFASAWQKGESMDDLISRQAAISHVDDVPYIKDHPNVGLLWKAWIESLPSAQPEQRWIPCSERLPEERGFYLTTTKDKAVYCDYWNEDNFDRTEMVIAWMPLPEPYREERTEE